MPKIRDQAADTSPSVDDLILTTHDPAGTPADRKVALGDLPVSDPVQVALDAQPEVTTADADNIVVVSNTIDVGPKVVRRADIAYFTADLTIPGTSYVDLDVDVVIPAAMVCAVRGSWTYGVTASDDIRLRLDLDQTLQECFITSDLTQQSVPLTANAASQTIEGNSLFPQVCPIIGMVQGHATLDTTMGFSVSKVTDVSSDATVYNFHVELIQLSGL